MNGYCSDCGEGYELDALNLDLRCADCVEQLVIDNLEREGKQVRDLEMALNVEAEWVLERLSERFTSDTDRNYYQGRLDQLAQVRRILGHNQLLINK